MSLELPQGATCFLDANIFVYHFVEVSEVSSACIFSVRKPNA